MKPVASVKPVRRLEKGHRPGFKAHAPIAPLAGYAQDVPEHESRDAFPPVRGARPHRFDLAVRGVQFLDRAAPDERTIFPDGPERDIRFPEPLEIERMTDCAGAFTTRSSSLTLNSPLTT